MCRDVVTPHRERAGAVAGEMHTSRRCWDPEPGQTIGMRGLGAAGRTRDRHPHVPRGCGIDVVLCGNAARRIVDPAIDPADLHGPGTPAQQLCGITRDRETPSTRGERWHPTRYSPDHGEALGSAVLCHGARRTGRCVCGRDVHQPTEASRGPWQEAGGRTRDVCPTSDVSSLGAGSSLCPSPGRRCVETGSGRV